MRKARPIPSWAGVKGCMHSRSSSDNYSLLGLLVETNSTLMNTNRQIHSMRKATMRNSILNQSVPGSRLAVCVKLAATLCVAFCLAGCGTTSTLKPAQVDRPMDFSAFSKVVVRDFEDKATEHEKPARQEAKRREMQRVSRDFADRLASEIEKKAIFQTVLRSGPEDESTLLISGNVSRYEEGSATARFLVGMGAGSSYFDASVEFRQGYTRALLGTIKADKNSWVLGGGLAAGQTPEIFMQEAAMKVANEVQKAKSANHAQK